MPYVSPEAFVDELFRRWSEATLLDENKVAIETFSPLHLWEFEVRPEERQAVIDEFLRRWNGAAAVTGIQALALLEPIHYNKIKINYWYRLLE